MVDRHNGRLISELLAEHKDALAKLKAKLKEDSAVISAAEEEDDLILIRFLLQAGGDVDEAEATAKRGREDRLKYRTVLEAAGAGKPLFQDEKVRKKMKAGRWTYPDPKSEQALPPLLITRSGFSDLKGLMDECSHEEVTEWFLWNRARIFGDCIRRTKETGRLVCMVSVNDFANLSLLQGREPRLFKAVGESAKAGEGLFPLLGTKHVMVNTGMVFQALYAAASYFMSQKALDKVAVISSEELCDKIGAKASDFPDFLGGSCNVPIDSALYLEACPF